MLLDRSILENTIQAGLDAGADFVEVFVEKQTRKTTLISTQSIKDMTYRRLSGAGIRIFEGKNAFYAHTNDLSQAGLLACVRQLESGIKKKSPEKFRRLQEKTIENKHRYHSAPDHIGSERRLRLLRRMDQVARAVSSDIIQVEINLIEDDQNVLIANSQGLLARDHRQWIKGGIQALAERKGERYRGISKFGALSDFQYLESLDKESLASTASQMALNMVNADYAPACEVPVVLNNGFGGVIFHEACGHGLETTAVAKNASVFCGKLGEKVANECVTAIDDGTLINKCGSINIDDEGMSTEKTVLIEKGVLKSYLVDHLGHLRTGYRRTGSGRRQDYSFQPTSRMRNTFLAPGSESLEKLISQVDEGLFAKTLGGGSVNPATGAYNFEVLEAYWIKNGQLDRPLKGASLIGTGIETLGRITHVGKDLQLENGTCGSVSGWIPVTVGQPPITVSKLTVGGRT